MNETFAHFTLHVSELHVFDLWQHEQSPILWASPILESQFSMLAMGIAIAPATGAKARETPIKTARMIRSNGIFNYDSMATRWAKALKSQCAAVHSNPGIMSFERV